MGHTSVVFLYHRLTRCFLPSPTPRVDCRSNVVGSVLSLYLGTFGTSFFSVTCTTLIVANFPARKARINRVLPKRKARTNRVLHRTTSGAVAVPGHVTTLSSSPSSTPR